MLISFFALYLPFSIVMGVAYRFLYLAVMAYVGLVVIAIEYARKINKPLSRLGLGAAAAVLLINVQQSHLWTYDWKRAGDIVQTAALDFHRMHPSPEGHEVFVFHDLPHRYGKAILFLNNLRNSMIWNHTSFESQIFKNSDVITTIGPDHRIIDIHYDLEKQKLQKR